MSVAQLYKIIVDDPKRVSDFVTGITHDYGWKDYTAIGLERNGKIVAGVTYDGYNGVNICLHIAILPGRKSLNRDFLWCIFHYPFEVCKVKRITGIIPSSNADSLQFAEGLKGATLEATLKQAHPDGDLIIFRMFKEDCIYLKDRYGRKIKQSSTTT